jgi:hypothetical protein
LNRQRLALPSDIVAARASVDTRLQAARLSLARRDADQIEQTLQTAEATVQAFEKLISR